MTQRNAELQKRLKLTGRDFVYPPTPAIATSTEWTSGKPEENALFLPRFAWVAVAVLILLVSGLLFMPSVRAALVEWLQIGAVRIWLVEPTSTPLVETKGEVVTPSARSSVLELRSERTLEDAQAELDFEVRLPAYPPDLGKPDHVFLERVNGPFVILVWTKAEDPNQVELVLYQMGPGVLVTKGGDPALRETTVQGRPAVWLSGEHYLFDHSSIFGQRRIIDQEVLIWTENVGGVEVTYRLETDLAQEEAVRIAESLIEAEN